MTVNGKPSEHILGGVDMTLLKIKLSAPLYPNETVTIGFSYRITLANVWHRTGFGDNTVNLCNIIPLLCPIINGGFTEYPYFSYGDPFVSEIANFEVTLIAPSKYIVAATGKRTSREADGNKMVYTYSASKVRDFALVLSERFIIMSETVNGVEINYFYFKDVNPAKSLKCAVDAYKTFLELFGNYPYQTLNVVQADFCQGGMEYPQLVTLSGDLKPEDMPHVIAHEIAHQWWYGLVGNNQVEDAWLDEGLAEFSTMLFYKKNPSYGNYDELMSEAYAAYKLYVDVVRDYKKNVDTSMNRPLGGYTNSREYSHMCYLKGMLMFESLYKTMGEKRFLKGIKNYYDDNVYTLATPDDLFKAFSRAYGAPLDTWFLGWIEGKNVV